MSVILDRVLSYDTVGLRLTTHVLRRDSPLAPTDRGRLEHEAKQNEVLSDLSHDLRVWTPWLEDSRQLGSNPKIEFLPEWRSTARPELYFWLGECLGDLATVDPD
jgi:hypothetical protein